METYGKVTSFFSLDCLDHYNARTYDSWLDSSVVRASALQAVSCAFKFQLDQLSIMNHKTLTQYGYHI